MDLTHKILIIDDDIELTQILAMQLRTEGFSTTFINDGTAGFEEALTNPYDVIILDISMPPVSGLDICKELRANGVSTPILLLSGHSEKTLIVQGLEYGADDYLTKPFTFLELLARINALIRRNRKNFIPQQIEKYGVTLFIESGTVTYKAKAMSLTPKEALLLKRLLNDAPVMVKRNVLLEDVWGIDENHTSNRLDAYIKRIRSKLVDLCGRPMIHTVRGRGYYFGPKKPE